MKKPPRKLVLHRQTVRVLTHIDLARAIGGVDSDGVQCPEIADSGAKACTFTIAAAAATTACG